MENMMNLDYDNVTNKFRFYPDTIPADELKIIGGRFSKSLNCYLFPPLVASYEALKRLYGEFKVTQEVYEFLGYDLNYPGYPEELIPDINKVIFKHQKEALCFLVNNPHKGLLLSLAQGLGKTLVTIAAATCLGFKNILVVCPLTLTRTWSEEIEKWTGKKSLIVHQKADQIPGWTIANYETVTHNLEAFKKFDWDLIVCDESILLKNGDADRSKKIKELAATIPYVWLLSGSPVSRYADDLYSQFNIMLPQYFTSYWRFADTYCYIMKTNWGTEIVGTKRIIDFRHEFSDILFRRNKEEVDLNLPDMLFETYSVDLTPDQRQVYDDLENEFIAMLDNETISVTTKLALMTRLQQAVSNLCNFGENWKSSSGKLDLLLELVKDEEIETPCIIWTNWIATGKAIQQAFHDHNIKGTTALIQGSTSAENRSQIINWFKEGKIKYLILSLGTGKYGLTLTEAKTMIYFDKSFDGDAYVQSQDRVHRIGLDHQPVVLSLVAHGTIDELIADNLLNKAVSMSKINGSEMKALFQSLKKK